MYLNFNEYFGHLHPVYLQQTGKYTTTVKDKWNYIDTNGNSITGKEAIAGDGIETWDPSIYNYYSNYNNHYFWKSNKDYDYDKFNTGYFYPDTSTDISQVPDINTLKNFEFEIRFYDNGSLGSYFNNTFAYVDNQKKYIDNTWSANRDWHYNPAYNPLNNYPYRAWRIKFTDGDN